MSLSPPAHIHSCACCGLDVATLKCSRCVVSFYCDPACQRKDWGFHKKSCRTAPVGPPPSPPAVAALAAASSIAPLATLQDTELLSAVARVVHKCDTRLLRTVVKLVAAGASACAVSKAAITVDGVTLPSHTTALHVAMQVGVNTQSLLDSLRPACGPFSAALRTWAVGASPQRTAPISSAPLPRVTPFFVALSSVGQPGGERVSGNDIAVAWVKRELGDEGFSALCAEPCYVQLEGAYPISNDVLWPLHVTRSLGIAELLIRAGADPNAVGLRGTSPLEFTLAAATQLPAYRATSAAFVNLLLAAGAKTETRNSLEHGGALDMAASSGLADIVKILLLSGADATPVPFSTEVHRPGGGQVRSTTTYLACAVQRDYADVLRVLHEAGKLDVNARTPDALKQPLLHYAIACGSERCYMQLIERGADPNATWTTTASSPLARATPAGVGAADVGGSGTAQRVCLTALDTVAAFVPDAGKSLRELYKGSLLRFGGKTAAQLGLL